MSTPDELPNERTPDDDFHSYREQSETNGWPVWAAAFLTAFSRVPNVSRASDEAGVNSSTAHRLVRRSDSFSDALEEARSVALDRMETQTYLRGTIGTPVTKTMTKTKVFKDGTQETTTVTSEERHVSDILLMFYLKRWRPEYRERFGEQSANDGASAPVEIEEKVHEAAQRLRAEVIRLADRRGAAEPHQNGSG